ncbi:MAG: hypothetical protein ACJ768_02855 [Gaiellaceae bacterium]
MTTLTSPPRLFEFPLEREGTQTQTAHERSRTSDGGRLTLEQRLDRVWEGLSAAGAAACPLCGGRMVRATEAAQCMGCGSRLT